MVVFLFRKRVKIISTSPIIVIAGATASGKSAYAMKLAEQLGGAIINADSMQLYRDLPTLTARPSAEDEVLFPHYLYGILDPHEQYSAGKWLDTASEAIRDCWQKNLQPIIVGGTGLYIKALIEGMAPIPDVDLAIRAEGQALQEELGAEAFYSHLVKCDPLMVDYEESQNPRRVLRAWEVWRQTGKSIKAWHQETHYHPLGEVNVKTTVLQWEREALYARCDQRFHLMLEAGALEEVRELRDKHSDIKKLSISRVLGVLPFLSYLEGECSLAEAAEIAQRDTRRYAKRQDTWFRNQLSDAEFLSQ